MDKDIISLLYPIGYTREEREEHKLKDFEFIDELQIDTMIILIKDSYRGIPNLNLKDFFTTDTKVLEYRLNVVEDLINNKKIYELFCKAIPVIQNIQDVRKSMSSDSSVESSLGSVRFLEMYIEIVELFYEGLEGASFISVGLNLLKKKIKNIVMSEEYLSLKSELAKSENNFGLIKSITVGVNLDETLHVQDAGILSVNMKHFSQGSIMYRLLKKPGNNSFTGISPLLQLYKGLHPADAKTFDGGIRSALNSIFLKTIKSFEPAIQKYFSLNTAWFTQLLDDIRFLTAGVKFIFMMKENGFIMCKPSILPINEKKCDLSGVYNASLAIKNIEKMIVSNSFSYDNSGRFYLVTGPNHGGKSIFAYSIGITQALFQLGLYVPAISAAMSPSTGIFTHFPTSDEDNFGKGRLESECARLQRIVNRLEETDILLMDESFSSTSGIEASYIASEVLTGIGIIGCGGVYVTHIHDLTQKLEEYNTHPKNKGKIDNLVAQMESRENGLRSYKVERTTPDGLSYAKDIAAKYGLSLDSMINR